jgi:hypothetical protein
MIGAILAYLCVQITWKDVGWALLSALLVGVIVLFIEFLVRAVICTPPKLHSELQGALDLKESEAAALRKEKEEKPRLVIELENESNGWIGSQDGICIVIVRNTSQYITASEVGLSLVEIVPDPQNPPRPLPYELGKAGTNCAIKNVQLHPDMPEKFELFRYVLESNVHFRNFRIQDVPQVNQGFGISMLTLQSQEGETKEWQLKVRATGLHLETVTQIFKLVSEARSVPRLFKV